MYLQTYYINKIYQRTWDTDSPHYRVDQNIFPLNLLDVKCLFVSYFRQLLKILPHDIYYRVFPVPPKGRI